MRVQTNPTNFGRCGCGRREYCDGSHGLSEAQWQAVQAKERAAAGLAQPQESGVTNGSGGTGGTDAA